MSHAEIVLIIQQCIPSDLKGYDDIEIYLLGKYPIEFNRFRKTVKYIHYKQQVYIWLRNKAKKSINHIKHWYRAIKTRQLLLDTSYRMYSKTRKYENDTTLIGDKIIDIKPTHFFQLYSANKWYAFDIRELIDMIDKRQFDLHTGKYVDVSNPYTRERLLHSTLLQIERIRKRIGQSTTVIESNTSFESSVYDTPTEQIEKYKRYLMDQYKAHVRQLRTNLDSFAGCDIDVDYFVSLDYNETIELIIGVRNHFTIVDMIVEHFPGLWKSFSKLYKSCTNKAHEIKEYENMYDKHNELVVKTFISFIDLLNHVLNKSSKKQELAFMVYTVYKTIVINHQLQHTPSSQLNMLHVFNNIANSTNENNGEPQSMIHVTFYTSNTLNTSNVSPDTSDDTESVN